MNKNNYLPLSDEISKYEYITDQSISLNERVFIKQILFYNLFRFAGAPQTVRILSEINEFI